MPDNGVSWCTEENCACWLSLTVALNERSTQDDFQEILYFWKKRSTSWNHKSTSASKSFLCFGEENSIVNSVSVGATILEVIKLSIESIFQSGFSKALKFAEFLLENLIKSWEKSWNAQEDCWFNYCQIILKSLNISWEVNNTASFVPEHVIKLSFEDVRKRQVRQPNIFLCDIGVMVVLLSSQERSEVFMGDHSTLRRTSCSRSVRKGQAVIRKNFVLFAVVVN